jgi:hypothetical protein
MKRKRDEVLGESINSTISEIFMSICSDTSTLSWAHGQDKWVGERRSKMGPGGGGQDKIFFCTYRAIKLSGCTTYLFDSRLIYELQCILGQ